MRRAWSSIGPGPRRDDLIFELNLPRRPQRALDRIGDEFGAIAVTGFQIDVTGSDLALSCHIPSAASERHRLSSGSLRGGYRPLPCQSPGARTRDRACTTGVPDVEQHQRIAFDVQALKRLRARHLIARSSHVRFLSRGLDQG